MPSHGVGTDDRNITVGTCNEHGHSCQHVLEHRHVVSQGPQKLHPELRERPTGDHRDALVDPPLDEACGQRKGVDWCGAKRFDVASGRSSNAARLR